MIIKIDFDGKEVLFNTSLAWAIKYKSQFKRDALKDLAPVFNGDIDGLGLDIIAQIAWASAALCDPGIEPDVMQWVLSLGDGFNYQDITTDVIAPIIEASITSKKSKAPATFPTRSRQKK
jgi:hypothetical protein